MSMARAGHMRDAVAIGLPSPEPLALISSQEEPTSETPGPQLFTLPERRLREDKGLEGGHTAD